MVFWNSLGYLTYRKMSMKEKKQKRTISSIWTLVSAALKANWRDGMLTQRQ